MKKLLLFCLLLIALATSMTCHRNECVTEEVPAPNADTLSWHRIDRDDVPPPPSEPWWTLDTTDLDPCESRLWGYLRRMYPNGEEDYWDYDIYSIMDEPGETFASRAFRNQFFHFFNDTVFWQMLVDESEPCINVDSTFFLEALGQPTLRGC